MIFLWVYILSLSSNFRVKKKFRHLAHGAATIFHSLRSTESIRSIRSIAFIDNDSNVCCLKSFKNIVNWSVLKNVVVVSRSQPHTNISTKNVRSDAYVELAVWTHLHYKCTKPILIVVLLFIWTIVLSRYLCLETSFRKVQLCFEQIQAFLMQLSWYFSKKGFSRAALSRGVTTSCLNLENNFEYGLDR